MDIYSKKKKTQWIVFYLYRNIFNVIITHLVFLGVTSLIWEQIVLAAPEIYKSWDLHGLVNTGHQRIGFLPAEGKGKTTHTWLQLALLCYQFTDSFRSIIESPSECNQLTVVAFNSELMRHVWCRFGTWLGWRRIDCATGAQFILMCSQTCHFTFFLRY